MDTHVAVEVARLTEAQETEFTLIGLLAGMDPEVFGEGGGVAEGLLAHPAAVRSLARVCAHVRGDGGRLRKLAVTDGAAEGFFPTMSAYVGRQVGSLAERFVAVVAPSGGRETK